AIWSGVTTIELAKGIEQAIRQNLTGLYHFVPSKGISKFDLLKLFTTSFERNDIKITPNDTVSLDKTLVNTRQDFKYNVPDYAVMINEMRASINTHKGLYPHYE